MIKKENRLRGSLILNILVIVLEMHSLFIALFVRRNFDIDYFAYYTHLSALSALLSSSLLICGLAREMIKPRHESRSVFGELRYLSICMQTLTLLVVLFIILPSDIREGRFSLRRYMNVIDYLICPVVSIVSMFAFGDYTWTERKDALTAFIPTFFYAAVMVTLNALGIYSGPYDFLRVRDMSFWKCAFWALLILSLAYAVNRTLIALSHRFTREYS